MVVLPELRNESDSIAMVRYLQGMRPLLQKSPMATVIRLAAAAARMKSSEEIMAFPISSNQKAAVPTNDASLLPMIRETRKNPQALATPRSAPKMESAPFGIIA